MDYGAIGPLLGEVGIIIALVRVTYWLGGVLARIEKDVESLRRDVDELKTSISELRERLGRVEDRLSTLVRAFMGQNGIMISLVGQLEKRAYLRARTRERPRLVI